ADSAGAPGCAVSPVGRGRDPAPQLCHLRHRWRDRPLHRDQGHRRHPRLPAPGVTMVREHLRPAVVLTLLLCLITGPLYPGVVTVFAQLLLPSQANGSLIVRNGHPVGSRLVGQAFSAPYYFHPRPSAAGSGYDATASGGTNKGPTDRKLADTLIAQAVEQVVREDGAEKGHIPSD